MAPIRASAPSVPVAARIERFSYAIRSIVAEARKVEASGRRVRYLNIGDPVAFGFATPRHLITAVERALRDGHNGYGPSAGIPQGRDAVAAEYTSRGFPVEADRTFLTAGTSEGIELILTALVDEGTDVLVPLPVYPLYTAVLAKLGARALCYRTDPQRGWTPDLEHLESLITPATRALVINDPNNPTGACYSTGTRRALLDLADRHALAIVADEVYGDLGYEGPIAPLGSLDPDAPIISISSLSKAYLAPGWRTGWIGVGRTPRLNDVVKAIGKLADARLCSTLPMQHAVTAALTGDRSHQVGFRTALKERAALTHQRLNAIPGVTAVAARAAFYAMPRVALPAGRTDEDFVLALVREAGVLCVHGSGFGMAPSEGYFRIVFLASPDELDDIYRLIAEFTIDYLRRPGSR
ncbi:MAG TPA: aminotransferase class I/II-fold pyridoxal phosphate-dependent enzyme [Vicinamibacterales bacterium]|nr:aminotransferase class I/II-fold pyridoxal phosphate-dependent enzyme [Vicinamibacterales bacterium]